MVREYCKRLKTTITGQIRGNWLEKKHQMRHLKICCIYCILQEHKMRLGLETICGCLYLSFRIIVKAANNDVHVPLGFSFMSFIFIFNWISPNTTVNFSFFYTNAHSKKPCCKRHHIWFLPISLSSSCICFDNSFSLKIHIVLVTFKFDFYLNKGLLHFFHHCKNYTR